MSRFRTKIELPDYEKKLDYRDKIVLMGSCFAESIGEKLTSRCFPVDVNPFGILYNPVSVGNSLELLMEEKKFKDKDIFFANGRWNSYHHHSRFSHQDKKICLEEINKRVTFGAEQLRQAGFLFITFGTAWVYENRDDEKVVSNCHKQPVKQFLRYRLNVDETVARWETLLTRLWEMNPGLQVIFTVSPIRHWKDGAHENQISKSVLFLIIETLLNRFEKGRIAYFPSYEIVMDELRDYRFYAPDMVHLGDTAVDYIWERFSDVLITKDSLSIMNRVEKLRRATEHRPFDEHGRDYRLFLDNQLTQADKLMKQYPFLNIQDILEYFLRKLKE
ncbi:GSCFA domain-containing protein [Prolixibacter denitrificans]|uniref:GSCFA domain-containing protein n=1 Tax=Prolixibacter denitrificans TaxID=1541063 RepID=A0ABQ0ZHJ8_9BACT|nr:GSCFA domain-containing protein [Prolixibacter denitrificans]GET20859.1 hypothetical protein JCM18694_11050 [Prolixibacter denitrificans]